MVVLPLTQGRVFGVAFSPDGKKRVSGSEDATVSFANSSCGDQRQSIAINAESARAARTQRQMFALVLSRKRLGAHRANWAKRKELSSTKRWAATVGWGPTQGSVVRATMKPAILLRTSSKSLLFRSSALSWEMKASAAVVSRVASALRAVTAAFRVPR
jgi:hypothetical protein